MAFKTRFNIKQIGEFYSATEGNSTLFNIVDKPFAVGYIPPIMTKLIPIMIIKFDTVTETPIRNDKGFCMQCEPGEIGELVGQIDETDPTKSFMGYTNREATEKKILRNVFVMGDAYFRTGDLLKKEERGYYYFVDRVGDTFRWKGENVSTSEVEFIISQIKGVKEVNVFGVQVPRRDGRAGMAIIVINPNEFDMKNFYAVVTEKLASYAAPLFIKFNKEMNLTTTFKHIKVDLVKEGINPSKVKDIYVKNDNQKTYIPFTSEHYNYISTTDHHIEKIGSPKL